ncbi:MBL fold metallo-hydrolase [Gordonia sp. DT219]|uniref:MBL fold metallo-hydrolase n=1 Tax=Gordonia sp. DT219 TaxID=3416658 RepID=UPI003CFAA02B
MRIGSISIEPLRDGSGTEQAGEIISRFSDPEAWRCHPDHFGDDGRWSFPVGGFLVRTGDRVVLVDAGVGPMDEDGYVGGALLDSLAEHGVTPPEVTDVVFTHLHFDHIGWTSVDGSPVFPNATYRCHEADWTYFVDGPTAAAPVRDKLLPIRERFIPFTGDHQIAPGLDARAAPGHTPGSTVFVASSGERRAILLGDVVHSAVQLSEPDWTVVWDVDPVAASQMRNALADEAAARGDLVVAAHFPEMRFGRVLIAEGRRQFSAIA